MSYLSPMHITMEMQISNASEFPLYHSMATGPHPFQLPGAIPPVSTIPAYKNNMFPDRLNFYYDSAGVTHAMPPERCDRCYVELSAIGGAHHFGKKLCGMCAAKEQQQVSPKVEAEILDLDSQQVMSRQQQQQQQQQQQDTGNKAFLQHGGGGGGVVVVVPPGYDRPPPPPPPPAVEWPGYFQPQQNTLSGEHLSPDYNNVTTTTTTPPTMMGGSPSSDMQQQQQQQYQNNFDGGYAIDSNQQPVGGGGGAGGGGGGTGSKGNGSWKSNEARRAKTYECPACDKWFTSSGHLKRHYGTQLHKNAVKQSGKPDPALLPMKHHYHPYRDPAYVAQQKLKQQQHNGGGPSLHKQQSSMMLPADFRPVSSTSSFNTDPFLELTPPNLTASLSDSLGGTQLLPARQPVSSSSSNSMEGFTDANQISSYHNNNSNNNSSNNNNSNNNNNSSKYLADPTASDRTVHRHQATSYHDHRQSTHVQLARSAYRHHQIMDTIQPYTTQVSMTRQITNTDSYITMADNNDGSGVHHYDPQHLYDHHPHQHHHHHSYPNHHQQHVDYQPSSTSPSSSAPPYPQPQQYHHLQQFQHQPMHIKQEPVDVQMPAPEYHSDTPLASPDSSIDHLHHHQHHEYSGLLVMAPISSSPPPPPPPPALLLPFPSPLQQQQQQQQQQQHLRQQQLAAADDDAAVSDGSGSVELELSSSSSSPSPCAKKFRKTTRVTCQLCNKDFTDKCYKTQHDQRFHSGEKPYRCGVCGKRFGEHKLLEVHELRHNDNNKAFPCTVCTKSFNFKNDLDRHFISSHSTEKPYQCVQCKKKFVRLDHKRHHEKTHGGTAALDKTKKKKKTAQKSSAGYTGYDRLVIDEDQSS